jgi:hypothetical protein
MKLLLIVAGLLFTGSSCMKKKCYECKDQTGAVVQKGCDKTVDEIESIAASHGLNCKILPD